MWPYSTAIEKGQLGHDHRPSNDRCAVTALANSSDGSPPRRPWLTPAVQDRAGARTHTVADVVHLYYACQVVNWSKRADYIWSEHQTTTMQADEALADPDRVVLDPDPASRSGVSVRTIGYSAARGALVTVITVEEDNIVYGVNAWGSNPTDRRRYRERNTP